MTWVWMLLAIVVGGCALFAYVRVRDRRRLSSADDDAANRESTSIAERHAADRHGPQGTNTIRDQMHGGM